MKRLFDIFVACFALVLLAPLLIMVALLVKFASPGRVLYGHQRVGRNGKLFRCWKFRTMVENGDEVLRQHLLESPVANQEWLLGRKLRFDPRVTPVGQVLRTLSLDELPQLFNVLRGDMSLVGPRPVVLDELSYYGEWVQHYYSIRPGLTGLWQVSGRNDVSYDVRVHLDRSYVDGLSLRQDLFIILKTVPAVVFRRGTY